MRRHVYIALNKPVGITCTTDQGVDGNIVDFIDHQQRIFPIGRLDKDSEGLILLTSNGDIVNELLRLTLLAPDIIEQFMAGKQPRRLTLMWFQRNRLMVDWQAQRQLMATFEEDV